MGSIGKELKLIVPSVGLNLRIWPLPFSLPSIDLGSWPTLIIDLLILGLSIFLMSAWFIEPWFRLAMRTARLIRWPFLILLPLTFFIGAAKGLVILQDVPYPWFGVFAWSTILILFALEAHLIIEEIHGFRKRKILKARIDKPVKCAECGFLAVRDAETRSIEEIELDSRQNGDIKSRFVYIPLCFCRIVKFDDEVKKLEQEPRFKQQINQGGETIYPKYKHYLKDIFNSERQCKAFTKWHQGFTPKEHQEDERKKSERILHWIEVLVLVIVAGLFTLLGAWITSIS